MHELLPKVCGTLCMFMHVGFSMVETGSCRARNASDLLIKNVLSLGSIGDSKLDVQRCAKGKLPRHLFSGFCHFVHLALHAGRSVCVAALAWWSIGWGFAFGETANGLIGTTGFSVNSNGWVELNIELWRVRMPRFHIISGSWMYRCSLLASGANEEGKFELHRVQNCQIVLKW